MHGSSHNCSVGIDQRLRMDPSLLAEAVGNADLAFVWALTGLLSDLLV